MATLDDLNNAVASIQAADTAIQAAVTNAVALIMTLHTGAPGTLSDADVEAAVTSLKAAASDFTTATTSLAGAKALP